MNYPLQPHDFFVVRTPLLPYSTVADVSPESIRRIYQQSLIQEALYIASPDLHQSLQKWLAGETTDVKVIEKLTITLTKYLLRMSYRCTPFGIFAGISTGYWHADTHIRLQTHKHHSRRSRLDMDFLCALVVLLVQQIDIRKKLRFYPNNTLYAVGNRLRYVEYQIKGKGRIYHLTHVETSDYLERLLAYAQHGKTPEELARFLVDEEISYADAWEFVNEVIDSQVLVSELEVILTGKDYAQHIIQTLQHANNKQIKLLEQATDGINQLDKQIFTDGKTIYQAASQKLRETQVNFDPGQLIQVDMYKPAQQARVSSIITEELQKTTLFLARLKKHKQPENLTRFKEAFTSRYESRRVPLMEALDAEAGIGYPVEPGRYASHSSLLENIIAGKPESTDPTYPWTEWQDFLLKKYLKAIQEQTDLILTENEVTPFLTTQPLVLPPSFYTLCSVLAPNCTAVDNGNFYVYHHGSTGPSAANLLGRFCHLDEALAMHVRNALHIEQASYPEAILAEVVHINQARIGNISARPVLRDYEIPIMVQSGVDEAHTLALSDLSIGIQQNRIVLYSNRLHKEVIPRLSSAHNYTLQALPYYHFLCDLQFQDTMTSIRWDWGALQEADFLPRVVFGKSILSVAKWTLHSSDLESITKVTEPALHSVVAQLRQQKNIPRYITLAEGDNELPIDLENSLCLKVLQQVIRNRKKVVVEENIFTARNLFVESEEGNFTNELIIPWQFANKEPGSKNSIFHTAKNPPVTRSFAIGSEWIYFKIYCGIKTADELITEALKPLADQLIETHVIDRWFFIRFTDPNPHIRVRFHGAGHFYAAVIAHLNEALKPYLQAGLVSAIQTDTYQRELERYDEATIDESEHLFYHDSQAVAAILSLLENDSDATIRWQLALKGIDCLLNDFHYSLPDKKEFLDLLQQNFKQEFDATHAEARKSFASKYRLYKLTIEQLLAPNLPENHELMPAIELFRQRSVAWQPLIDFIRLHHSHNPAFLRSLVGSYLHLFVNRLCNAQQRMHELVLYDLLYQYYTAAWARTQKESL